MRIFRRVSPRHYIPDLIAVLISAHLALYLRVDTEFKTYLEVFYFFLPILLLTRLIAMRALGCYKAMWRYISVFDAIRLSQAIFVSTGIMIAVPFFFPTLDRLPRSVYIIEAMLGLLGLMSLRLARRWLYERKARKQITHGVRTLIYGAGQNGRTLATRFNSDATLNTQVLGFIDDDPTKQDCEIHGIHVVGGRDRLPELIARLQIEQLIIAITNLSGEKLRALVELCRANRVRPRITSTVAESDRTSAVAVYREVELADLLSRPKKEINLEACRELLRGKRILVTGAGGSIGAELVRQILNHSPGTLVLLDHSEYALYEIDKEIRSLASETCQVRSVLMDLKDSRALHDLFRDVQPEVVFHAAAYKHVHLVESNPYTSVVNNIGSTNLLLECCRLAQTQTFVLVSTDKAVNPAGIMGATKRVCELLVTLEALETGRRYCSVRFGNVLGSSGSVIPLMKEQILRGGPVTVTHADVTRYFMLIPEAVSLVLKAATIAQPGDINVLKMGEPIRILEVAKSLIALMGRSTNEIEIKLTGLRPGEKLFEELYIRGDELKTEHPDILTIPNGDTNLVTIDDRNQTKNRILSLIQYAENNDRRALLELHRLVQSSFLTIKDAPEIETSQVLQ